MNNEYLEIAKNLKVVPGFARKLTRDFKPETKIALKKNEDFPDLCKFDLHALLVFVI